MLGFENSKKTRSASKDTIRIALDISPDVHERILRICSKSNATVTAFLRVAVMRLLEEAEKAERK